MQHLRVSIHAIVPKLILYSATYASQTLFPLLAAFQLPTSRNLFLLGFQFTLHGPISVEKSMEQEMGSEEKNTPSRPTRKRPCRRSSQGHFVINLADAGRDISSPPCVTEGDPILQGKSTNSDVNMPVLSDAQYCYSLLEAMPLPGPIWSTTSPSVMAEPPASASAPINNSVDFEWVENQDSSYSWWLGFLKSLDGNVSDEELNSQFVENFVMENSKILEHESALVDGMDQSCCPDDWLMIPSVEKDLEDINTMP